MAPYGAWNTRSPDARNDESHRHLLDLLAVIHRDGGHRADEVGAEQAWMEAMMMVPFMLQAQDDLRNPKDQTNAG